MIVIYFLNNVLNAHVLDIQKFLNDVTLVQFLKILLLEIY